jgi:hypothetical protein
MGIKLTKVKPMKGDCSNLVSDHAEVAKILHRPLKLDAGIFEVHKTIPYAIPIYGSSPDWENGTVLKSLITDNAPVLKFSPTDNGEYMEAEKFAIISGNKNAKFIGIHSRPEDPARGYNRFNIDKVYISGATTGMVMRGWISKINAFIKTCDVGFDGNLMNEMVGHFKIENCNEGMNLSFSQGVELTGMIEGCNTGLVINDFSYSVNVNMSTFEGKADKRQTHILAGFEGRPCHNIWVNAGKFVYGDVRHNNVKGWRFNGYIENGAVLNK